VGGAKRHRSRDNVPQTHVVNIATPQDRQWRWAILLVAAFVSLVGCCQSGWEETRGAVDGVYGRAGQSELTWGSLLATHGGDTGRLYLHESSNRRPRNKLKLHNYVVYSLCGEELKYQKYVSVAEIRDERLTRVLAGKKYIWSPVTPYFRRVPLDLQLSVKPDRDSSHDRDARWVHVLGMFEPVRNIDRNPSHFKKYVPLERDLREEKHKPSLTWPKWVQRDRIVAEHFVGTLSDGFLFAGTLPDQYFWLSGANAGGALKP
jgi:hypothetical protein